MNQMEELFRTYYDQCPNVKIKYAIYNSEKKQGHIVLSENWIEIIYFEDYQGFNAIKFSISRNADEFFFDSYDEAKRHYAMPMNKFNDYVLSITL